jgi:hypothetical protein
VLKFPVVAIATKESDMPEELEGNRAQATKQPALSLDSWAVIVALALSVAIWVGFIKHVPW